MTHFVGFKTVGDRVEPYRDDTGSIRYFDNEREFIRFMSTKQWGFRNLKYLYTYPQVELVFSKDMLKPFDLLKGVNKMSEKTLGNTDANGAKKNVKDIQFWGDGDTFKLICKASSQNEGWMKSTKAMEVFGGCVVQVSTQQGDNVAEALTFVPGVKIKEIKDDEGNVVSRKLIGLGEEIVDEPEAE